MQYNNYHYIKPPRATEKVAPGMLGFFEHQNWWAQIKKNGTNCVLFVAPNGDFRAMNRHGGDIKKFDLPTPALNYLKHCLPRDHWHVLNGEWLNDKTKTVKSTLYLHDLLVFRGEYLIDAEYQTRYQKLKTALVESKPHDDYLDHYGLGRGLWVAKNFHNNFVDVFKSLCNDDVDEGLVLKNPEGKLGFGKVDWAIKCRKPHKNYSF